MKLLSRIVRRGLEHDGRLFELSVIVQDKPGSIASLATVIAGQGANIYELSRDAGRARLRLVSAQWCCNSRRADMNILLPSSRSCAERESGYFLHGRVPEIIIRINDL